MKTKNIFLFTLVLIYSTSAIIAQSTEQRIKIKKTIQASYSAKGTTEMPRDSAFTSIHLERYHVYDDNETIIEYGQYDGEGNIYEVTKIQKDQNGKPLKGTIYDSKGNLKKYYTTVIDKNGNVTEFKNYNSENELVYLQKSEFDTNGNVTSRTGNNPKSDKVYKTELEYNSKNEIVKKIKYNSDGTIKDTRTYKYDINGNEIESELFRSNGDYTKFISKYDDFNNLTVQNWYDKEGNQNHQTSFKYTYDNHENWITKKRFSNSELGFIWERKIEYYK
jgi:hypothetical protein